MFLGSDGGYASCFKWFLAAALRTILQRLLTRPNFTVESEDLFC